jgi:predicted phosphodiesterase
MSNQIRWLHLSDFHFGKSAFEQAFSSKKIIDHLKAMHKEGINPDFVFITGDVANSGKKIEFDDFTNNLLIPLMDLYGAEFIDNVFVVPGNHDLDRNTHDGFSKEKFLKTDSEYFHPTVEGQARRKMLVERFALFCEHVPCNGIKEFSMSNGAFALSRQVGKHDVGIVGLNTAWLCDGEKDKEMLTPGIAITREALEKIDSTAIKFVLGHHPLEWINPLHVAVIKSVFGANQVIYLHGHMHIENFSNQINGSGEFVSIQSGAAWQAPEGGKWPNGFMWGTISEDLSLISLQPYVWSFENQCWTLDGTRFHENYRKNYWWEFDAPQKRIQFERTPKKKTASLISWVVKDLESLDKLTDPLDEADAIAYFDGATPTWRTALSKSIPRREIVAKVANNFNVDSDNPVVCALLAAGCEGKTTALLQAALEILKQDTQKKILFRTNHTRQFDPTELEETLSSHGNWLIVVDEADQIAVDILRFIENGFNGIDVRIDFLLASRDSDWQSSGARALTWDFRAKYKETVLKDLSIKDADLIVEAWGKFGLNGLGEELQMLPADERADKLRFHAKKEAKGKSDAFFGALLMCRHGSDLLQHAEAMLQKLSMVELDCGKSLKDVLGYIATMHSEGFDKLTFSALAALIDMPVPKLQNEVIRQLGKEAAATSTATSIFTRHKYIAMALVEVLETKFNEDISNYFIDLAISEVARSKTEHVIDLSFWRYGLAEKLFDSGKSRLAIQIAERLFEADDTNFNMLTKLASFYRKNGSSSAAISLFRNSTILPQHRGFYFEWGVCEGNQRHYLENALLAYHALSDDSEKVSLTVDQAKIYLTGLSKCYDQLHISFADPIFRMADDAGNSLLCTVTEFKHGKPMQSNEELDRFLKGVAKKSRTLYTRPAALNILKDASSKLARYGISEEVAGHIDISTASFDFLDTIVRNMEMLKR